MKARDEYPAQLLNDVEVAMMEAHYEEAMDDLDELREENGRLGALVVRLRAAVTKLTDDERLLV